MTPEYKFFLRSHGTFTKRDHILSHEEHLNGVKIIEMICYPPVDHNMKKSISIKEIESIINNLSNGKHQVLVGSWWILPNISGKIMSILYTLFQKIKTKGILANSFWGQPYPNIKSRQIHYKKEKLQTNSSHKQRCKKPPKTNKLNKMYKKNYTSWPEGIIPGIQGWSTHRGQCGEIYHINRLEIKRK